MLLPVSSFLAHAERQQRAHKNADETQVPYLIALIVGAYSGWALIRGWVLIKLSPFSESSKFILQQNNK